MGIQAPRVHQILVMGIFCLLCSLGRVAGAQEAKKYESKYCAVSSDFDPAEVKELLLRLDNLVVAFDRHFPTLRGAITGKYKLIVCRKEEAFYAAGVPRVKFTNGYHNGLQLVFILQPDVGTAMSLIQDYCYLQYWDVSIGTLSNSPAWLVVALSQYYKGASFAGDGYVFDLVSDRTLGIIQTAIRDGKCRPMTALMGLGRNEIFGALSSIDKYQLWSLIIFLERGENGKYHDAFGKYLHEVGRGISHKEAWPKAFGDVDIDARWREWTLAQAAPVVQEGFARLSAQILGAYLGRAALAGQKFTKVSDLADAIRSGSIRMNEADWLPPSLAETLHHWMSACGDDTIFEIGSDQKKPQIIVTLANKTRIVATFDPAAKDQRTMVEIDRPGHSKPPAGKPDEVKTTFVLKSAKFGVGNTWVDVTEKCQSMIAGDLILAPNGLVRALGVDPAQGGNNWLELHLVINGAAVRVTFADHKVLVPLRLTTQLPLAQE